MHTTAIPTFVVNKFACASYATPFDWLGLHSHPTEKGFVIRVWRPDAETVRVLEHSSKKLLGIMVPDGKGVFELILSQKRKRFNYQLDICLKGGQRFITFDPYQFGQYVLSQDDVDSNALYRHLGAHKLEHHFNTKSIVAGILFRVYAPNASSVSVIGSFNNWDGRIHPMASANDGIWRLFLPGVVAGDLYKYEIHDQQGRRLPLKSDPFGEYIEQWPGLASIVYDREKYCWSDVNWLKNRKNIQGCDQPFSIYEVHAGSWKRHANGDFLSYQELASELIPYVKNMGFTHIELMPISEHPFYGSWGYQPVGLFAPTSRYGSPDDFKYFVDQCHQAGVGVILDWVPAHFPNDTHGLVNFDGTALYEHPDFKRGWHPDWKACIYDFGKTWVDDFLVSNALYWLEEFHIDGLRVDAVASMLYLDYSRSHGEWEQNIHGGNENLEAIALLKRFNETVYSRHPDVITIAEESTSWPGVSDFTYNQGLGFGYKWNMGWMHDSLNYMKKDPAHRCYHHDQMTFSTVYLWSENFVLPLSHDEVVHGKGTLLTRMPGDDWQRFANLRAYLAFMFTHPGKKLLFMGGEIATYNEWDCNHSLDWSLLNQGDGRHKGIQTLVKKLNEIYRDIPSLHELDTKSGGFRWIVINDSSQSVFAFARYDKKRRCSIVINNLTPVVRNNYRIGVPDSGRYAEVLNTDSADFGGSGVLVGDNLEAQSIEEHGYEQSLNLTLPPLATVILVPYQ
ncbi:MAG: 1,4-alpha-glucan branching protein GlgB [Candidatus Endonucleobacter bathymodioli]|uniref:1,4-alpha-glucan branching enzyme GlgB n=1 Tax=Candidatus Endonucleibacter bathymodioli TaxID=539814 RepID=A0AA90NRI7_9GAMM|nr:1,4-alpha-glucan branching protein GlgB [Candidatus Endonucleobacter bathymodioli]